jgi:hypothetical protein
VEDSKLGFRGHSQYDFEDSLCNLVGQAEIEMKLIVG